MKCIYFYAYHVTVLGEEWLKKTRQSQCEHVQHFPWEDESGELLVSYLFLKLSRLDFPG